MTEKAAVRKKGSRLLLRRTKRPRRRRSFTRALTLRNRPRLHHNAPKTCKQSAPNENCWHERIANFELRISNCGFRILRIGELPNAEREICKTRFLTRNSKSAIRNSKFLLK